MVELIGKTGPNLCLLSSFLPPFCSNTTSFLLFDRAFLPAGPQWSSVVTDYWRVDAKWGAVQGALAWRAEVPTTWGLNFTSASLVGR
jgi:hypothetical protein